MTILKRFFLIAAISVIAFFALPAGASNQGAQTVTDGTSIIILGVNESSPPFSSRTDNNSPGQGYMVDVCRQSLIASARLQNKPEPDFKYQTVDTTTQFKYLRSGKIDVLCAPTTHTIERRQREGVMFSLIVFITGADFLSRVDKPIETLTDLRGHRVSAVKGTTTIRGLRDFVDQSEIDNIKIEAVNSHSEGVKKLELGLVHAHAGDQALLMHFRNSNPRFRLGGRLNSFEPYALAVRSSDLSLLNDIDQGLSALYRSGAIWDIFEKHFPDTEPSALLISAYILGGVPNGRP